MRTATADVESMQLPGDMEVVSLFLNFHIVLAQQNLIADPSVTFFLDRPGGFLLQCSCKNAEIHWADAKRRHVSAA